MKKILPHFLLFISLLSLVSCTITKRKYTGGFNISWNKKAPDAIRPHPTLSYEERGKSRPHTASNKVAQPNSSTEKIVIEQKTEKAVILQQVMVLKSPYKVITKSITSNPVVSIYILPTEKIDNKKITTKKDDSDWHLPLAIIFCILGVFSCLGVVFIIALSGSSIIPITGLLAELLPFLLLGSSLYFSSKAMVGGNNQGLIVCSVFDVIFLILLIGLSFSL